MGLNEQPQQESLLDQVLADEVATIAPETGEMTEVLFVTNRQNLLEILSSGVLAPRASYSKYYPDLLDLVPGGVPVFVGGVPSGALELAYDASDEGSFPVIVRTTAPGVPRLPGDPSIGVLTAPLALRTAAVLFRSERDLTEHQSNPYENIDPTRFALTVDPSAFAGPEVAAEQLKDSLKGLSGRYAEEAVFDSADRAAGALALLARVLRPSGPGVEDFSRIVAGNRPEALLPTWLTARSLFEDAVATDPKSADERLFGATVGELRRHRSGKGLGFSAVLAAIRSAASEGKLPKAAKTSIESDLATVSAVRIDDAEFRFGPVPGNPASAVARGLLYALMRPEPRRLRDYLAEAGSTDPVGSALAGVFVGLLTGRRRLSTDDRSLPFDKFLAELEVGLVTKESATHALSVHSESGETGEKTLVLQRGGEELLRWAIPPKSLAEVLLEVDPKDPKLKSNLVKIARSLGWHELVRTTIILPEGAHELTADAKRGRVSVSYVGEEQVIRSPDRERILERLANATVPRELEEEVRAVFPDTL